MLKKLTAHWKQQEALRAIDIADCDTFFFYGSLMERFNNFNRYLKKRVRSIDIGYCRGYLYNLPVGFPGMIVPEDQCSTLVAGEIMRFDNPLKMMKLLDRLERYIPGNEKKSIYLRRKLPLIYESTEHPDQFHKIEAWVYTYPEYHLSNEHHHEIRIECGQWKAFNGSAQPDAESDSMFQRLSISDNRKKVIIDPMLYAEPLLHNKVRPCHHLCENRHNCGWGKQQP
ncbi:MAG: gamma-glutamylcyclotransferase family protein [Thermodesulfobacteriota bacterium]|nr:gamma-glutamylcyclotransferase family protein [Thermodesulfobacteriota bacterium]